MFDKLKGYLPYLGAVLLFIVLSFVYFSPVLEGKQLPQLDNTHAKAMSKELNDYEKETGEKAMWTNSMFGGMPAYQIKSDSSKNIFSYLNRYTRLGLPYETVAIVFLYMLGFYLLLLSMKVDHWLSVIGAIAFAFGSYNLIIIIAGHITKTYAIALMAPVVAGVLYAYNRNRFIGAVITTVALGMEIAYNHVQITYYLAFMVGFIVLSRLVYAIKEKAIKPFAQTTGMLIIAAMLAVLPNITNLWTTAEYGKYSIRGASELTPKEGHKEHSGLDVDYAFSWSYGKHETLTLLIPNIVGGASEALANSDEAMKHVDPRLKEYVGQSSQYWGGRIFTSGPVYAGALICFLFFIGAFYYKGKERWWLIGITVFSILLAWGKNLQWFNYFMFYNFPLYNKFRTVEMALILASMAMPVLGFLGLKTILEKPEVLKKDSKWFAIAFALTGGVSLLFALFPGAFGIYEFLSPMESQQIGAQIQQGGEQAQMYQLLESNLIAARQVLMTSDAWRSFVFILLGSGSIWFFAQGKLQKRYLMWGLALIVFIDLWGVSKRYLNNDNFVTKTKARQELAQSKADQAILKDSDAYYRVFPIYRDPFKDGFTPYWHKSVGGFHGAKLRRYQDVADYYLMNDWQELMRVLQMAQTPGELEVAMENMPVLNMMNTKYIIYNPGAAPIFNPNYMGNAWFVKDVQEVANPDEEIAALGTTDLHSTAVVEKRFINKVQNYAVDSVMGRIQLTHYAPDYLIFESNAPQEQLAVFSDIYYDKGWKAYIDGEEAEMIRTNYILRGLMIPAGEHDIEFRFKPQSFAVGQTVAIISSIIILLLIIGAVVIARKKQ
ncbi:YfhO family protein [Carboxylicivirga mesophila]|uniref:YfhO family protein n=1 Tax=Carboxylicivirga mesophila TaxID=1166478 RepID=A0ABS5K4B0_9BACT|nr:YfhO family protein [Carboxylicivirga mesophila]MBS2209864.1 YfhO family protein [Carboxylicivirga mesophila]